MILFNPQREKERPTASPKAIICLIVTILFLVTGSVYAEDSGQLSLSLTAGNAADVPALELELEYKNGPWAAAIHAGYVGGIYAGGFEIGLLGRYCVDLSKGWDFYILLNPSVVVIYNEGPNVTFLAELGPGIEYRSRHFRMSLDIGPSFGISPFDTFIFFFAKLGIGYIF